MERSGEKKETTTDGDDGDPMRVRHKVGKRKRFTKCLPLSKISLLWSWVVVGGESETRPADSRAVGGDGWGKKALMMKQNEGRTKKNGPSPKPTRCKVYW